MHNRRNCTKRKTIERYKSSNKIKIVYGYNWHTSSDNIVLIKDEIDKVIDEVSNAYPLLKIQFQLLGGKDGSIYCDICRQIQQADIAIFDISTNNLNVIFELGLAIGSGAYVFMLSSTHYQRTRKNLSDLNGILEYRFGRSGGRIKFQSNFKRSFKNRLKFVTKRRNKNL